MTIPAAPTIGIFVKTKEMIIMEYQREALITSTVDVPIN